MAYSLNEIAEMRTFSTIDKIRTELAWVNETPDPNKRGCRNLRRCDAVSTKFWTFRWEYYCQPCREYGSPLNCLLIIQIGSEFASKICEFEWL